MGGVSFGLDVARKIASLSEREWVGLFEELRRERRLSHAVRDINALLTHPEYRPLAVSALKRMGLWHETPI